jgi:hypothetical protein
MPKVPFDFRAVPLSHAVRCLCTVIVEVCVQFQLVADEAAPDYDLGLTGP